MSDIKDIVRKNILGQEYKIKQIEIMIILQLKIFLKDATLMHMRIR